MSETGKEVKDSVYSKLKKILSSEEETAWSVHAHPQSTVLPSEPSRSQTDISYSIVCDLQRGPDVSCLPRALHFSTESESHNESDRTSFSAPVQPHLYIHEVHHWYLKFEFRSFVVCQVLSALLYITETGW